MVEPVPEQINFSAQEERTLELWQRLDAFRTSLELSKNRKRYTFYDGPPFATGVPHYGHVLAGTVKDIVTRWAHQSGFHVERRFGWDCHGLPVEYEIDKALNIRGPEDVVKMGIGAYNAQCRSIVMRYADIWEEQMTRLGRWIDFKNDYKTMYASFMESVWWVFKQLYLKGLVYRGHKVMPFSTACSTPLSNFESGQNYKDVNDPSVTVSFPLEESTDVSLLAWTTTPWTLPSNVALCVHPDRIYVKILEKATGKKYILIQARLEAVFGPAENYEVLDSFKGSTLEGKRYQPLFDYYVELMKGRGAYAVLTDTYVTEESGTGIVHQAPYFGEDDHRISLRYKIITKDMEPICPVDMTGRFTDPVSHFKGQYVKDADKLIIKWLKEHGRLVRQSEINHSYPFCWRSDTPLIYRAIPSWFVRVEHAVDQLLESNSKTYWVPDFVKEKRFGNWLRDARDWAVSRNRYWGTPLPLWVSEDYEEVVCVGSIAELQALTGRTDITDLHREFMDELTIPSLTGRGVLRRVPEVFDCWFESGAMPYAQNHYPFEHQREFEEGFPADFIAEGIDQTRGWFYTLLVHSTLLFGKPPFKNLVCHGLVLAADGTKMSKRKKNYPEIMDIVNKYGSDAIRLYLVNSPVVRADNLKFKEEGVRDILKDVFLPWYNAYRFLIQNCLRLHAEEGVAVEYRESSVELPVNYMDRWILSFTQSLIKFVKQEMEAYRLYSVLPRLLKFIEQLTNWYVRMNRRRLKGEAGGAGGARGGSRDCREALTTLTAVLLAITKLMAPFVPFITEHFYQNLRHLVAPEGTGGQGGGQGGIMEQESLSVHYQMLPNVKESQIDIDTETAVARMQTVIDLGRVIRDRKTLPSKYPLKEVVVIHKDASVLADIDKLSSYITEELNVKLVTVTPDKGKYGVHLRAEPDHKTLGVRLKGAFKDVCYAIRALTDEQLGQFQHEGHIEVGGVTLGLDDLRLIYTFDPTLDPANQYEAHSDNDMLVLLNVAADESMVDEGLAREVINRVQKLRKKAGLQPADEITVYYRAEGALQRVIPAFMDFILTTVKQPLLPLPPSLPPFILAQESTKVKEDCLDLIIVRRGGQGEQTAAAAPCSPSHAQSGLGPVCKYINVELSGPTQQGRQATLLLENPRGEYPICFEKLVKQVKLVFDINGQAVKLYRSKDRVTELTPVSCKDIATLHGSMLYAFTS